MQETWMEEAARNFGAQIRNEGLNKTQTRKLTGLSERKTRKLHDFIMGLTEPELEELTTTEEETTEEPTTAEAPNRIKTLVRKIRAEKADDEEVGELATILVEVFYEHITPLLEEVAEELAEAGYPNFDVMKELTFESLESAGYKWSDLRFQVAEEAYPAVKKALALGYKRDGKNVPAKIYKDYALTTDEKTIRFTAQVSTRNLE